MKKSKKLIAILISALLLVSSIPVMYALADGTEEIWTNTFETEAERNAWTLDNGDLDGDGVTWEFKSDENNAGCPAYDGIYSLYSESFSASGEARRPDNIAISEPISLDDCSAPRIRINWFVASQDAGFVEEHYSLYVFKVTDNLDDVKAAVLSPDTIPAFSETLSEKGSAYRNRSIDITEIVSELFPDEEASRNIRIVFRHHDSYDKFAVKIDTVSVEAYYEYNTLANYTFEDGLEGWSVIDGDGDGKNWEHKTTSAGFAGKDSNGCIASASYDNVALYPLNYTVSPQIEISGKYSSPLLQWYVASNHETYFLDHYSVYAYYGAEKISDSNINAKLSSLTPVFSETLYKCEYQLRSVALDESIVGNKIQLVFVHHDSSNQDWLKIDNISVQAIDKTKVIDSIEANGITPPELGAAPSSEHTLTLKTDGKKVPASDVTVTWSKKSASDSDYSVMSAGEKFVSSTSYRTELTIKVDEKYIFTDSFSTLTINGVAAQKISKDLSLRTVTVAVEWPPLYVVQFNDTGDTDIADIAVSSGSSVVAPPAPSKTGHSFTCWSDGLNTYNPGNSIKVTENTILTALWSVNTYKLTFMTYDGIYQEIAAVPFGSEISAPSVDPERTGYSFAGWTPSVPKTMGATDATYTATWTINQYQAVFNAGDGSFSDGSKTKTVTADYNTIPVFDEIPEKSGYLFSCWSPAVSPIGVNGATYEAVYVANKVSYTVETYIMSTDGTYSIQPSYSQTKTDLADAFVSENPIAEKGFSIDTANSILEGYVSPDNPLVLKICFARNQYKLSVTVDDKITKVTDYYYDSAVSKPADPDNKEGYTFAGWDGYSDNMTMPAEDLVFTAKWTANNYKVTWIIDGVIQEESYEFGEKINIPDTPEKEGYEFKEWSPAVPETMGASDATYTAIYELKDGFAAYTVELYLMNTEGKYDDTPDKVINSNAAPVGETVSLSHSNFEQELWFTADESAPNITSVEIAETGSVLKFYYKRAAYTVTVDGNPKGRVYHGGSYIAPDSTEEIPVGYELDCWTDGINSYSPGEAITVYSPLDLEAVTKPANNKVTLNISYKDILTGETVSLEPVTIDTTTTYTVKIVEERPSEPEENVTYVLKSELPAVEHYRLASEQTLEVKVADDGSAVLDLVYEVMSYTVYFTDFYDSVVYEQTAPCYTEIRIPSAPDLSSIGKTFCAWVGNDENNSSLGNDDATFVLEGDITFKATYTDDIFEISYSATGDCPPDFLLPANVCDAVYGTEVALPEINPVKGYTFNGWVVENAVYDSDADVYLVGTSNVTVTGSWTHDKYTVTYYLDKDYQVQYGEADEYFYGDSIVLPEKNPEKVGYSFGGWSEYSSEMTMPEENISLSASWVPNPDTAYKVIVNYADKSNNDQQISKEYNYNGTTDNNIAIVDYADIQENTEYVLLSNIIPEHYVLDSTAPNQLTGKIAADGSATLNIYCVPEIYTATLNSGHGSFEDGIKTVTVTADHFTALVTKLPSPPSREGYTFNGWIGITDTTVLSSDTAFEADWTVNYYTVTWIVDDNRIVEDYAYGSTINKPQEPEKAGYVFDGWDPAVPVSMGAKDASYTATWTTAKDTKYTVETYVMDEKGNYGNPSIEERSGETNTTATVAHQESPGFSLDSDKSILSGTIAADGSLVLKIYVSRNKYDLLLDVDGNVSVSASYYYGQTIEKPKDPDTKEGHTFDSWIGYSENMTMPLDGIKFTAKWTVNQYAVKWIVDGTVIEEKIYSFGDIVAWPENPKKEGHTFSGWTPEVSSVMGAADTTYTATWAVNTYTVTWIIDSKEETEYYVFGSEIEKRSAPAKPGYRFAKWSCDVPDVMPAENLIIKAEYECISGILIKNNPGSRKINYGDILRLSASVTNKPENAKIWWYVDGVKKSESETYDVSFESGTKTVEARLIGADGKVIKDANGKDISASEKITVNAGFFQKLISFFKNLFGSDRVIVQ